MELVQPRLAFDLPELQWASKVNEIEAVYKTKRMSREDLPKVTTPSETAAILREHYDDLLFDTIEYFSVLFLNRGNRIIGWQLISQGGITGTVADPRIILKMAILCGASLITLCHNHPSGNLLPSYADRNLTDKLKEAANYMDIKVLDHIILSSEGYYSFANEGLI